MATGKVKNWTSFQHYKDRSPPWIKLHRELLDNMEFSLLSPEAGKALPLVWLIASEAEGRVPEARPLAFRLRCGVNQAENILKELAQAGFLTFGDEAAPAEQVATPAQANGWGSRHISDKVKREVWARDGGKCCECSSEKNIEYDHIVPVSHGGGSEISNIQLLCRTCNRKKRNRLATPAQPLRSPEGEREAEGEGEARASKRAKKVTLADWMVALGEEEAVPAADPIFGWTRSTGIPANWIALAWWAFENRYGPDGKDAAKTYIDWRAVFRSAVKEDWLRLWRKGHDGWELTTAGENVRCEMEASA